MFKSCIQDNNRNYDHRRAGAIFPAYVPRGRGSSRNPDALELYEEIVKSADCTEYGRLRKSSNPAIGKPKVYLDSFIEMLTRIENDALEPNKVRCVCQDMTQPLSSYFISASHNTYLMGNQLQDSHPLQPLKTRSSTAFGSSSWTRGIALAR